MTQESFAIALWHFVCFSDADVEKKKIRVLPSGVEPMALWFLVQKEKAFLSNFLVQKAWLSCAPDNWEHKLIEYGRLRSVVLNRTVAYSDRHFDDLFGSIVIIFKAFVYRQLIVFYSTELLIWMVKSTNGTKPALILSHPDDHILPTKTWLLASNHFLWKRGYKKKAYRPVRERG